MYIYMTWCQSCEHLRTTLSQAEELSLKLQGSMTGFNTPRVVCDAPGGGESVMCQVTYHMIKILEYHWTSPSAKPGKIFYYFDPIHKLAKENQYLEK